MPNSCWAPGCVTGYRNPKGGYHGAGLSLFKAPKSPEERVVWERHIPRKNARLGEKHYLCELHFSPDDITRTKTIEYQSHKEHIPIKPSLNHGAVPTIFPSEFSTEVLIYCQCKIL